jgi:putative oxidoreductase
VVAGFLFTLHGIPKLFEPALSPVLSTRFVSSVLESLGGPLLILGLFTPATAFILSGEMAFAYFMVHAPHGFWGSFASVNLHAAILNCFLFFFLWQAGAGPWSLDGWWQRRRIPAHSRIDRLAELGTKPV